MMRGKVCLCVRERRMAINIQNCTQFVEKSNGGLTGKHKQDNRSMEELIKEPMGIKGNLSHVRHLVRGTLQRAPRLAVWQFGCLIWHRN